MTASSFSSAPGGSGDPSAPIRSVLFVCTGNVCRSPFAQLLLQARVPGLEITSRGTYALVGDGMEAQMAAQLAQRGVGATAFRSQQLEPADLGADLVLTMSDRQRALILEENPGAARRTGLLGHVPELVTSLGGAPLTRGAVAAWTRTAQPGGRNVPDPYRRPAEVAASTAAMIDDLVGRLAALLLPAPHPTSPEASTR